MRRTKDDPMWPQLIDWPYRKVTLEVTQHREIGPPETKTVEVDVVEGGGISVWVDRTRISVQLVGHAVPADTASPEAVQE